MFAAVYRKVATPVLYYYSLSHEAASGRKKELVSRHFSCRTLRYFRYICVYSDAVHRMSAGSKEVHSLYG